MLSRVLGFVRDVLTAAYLGAGPIADAFFVALKLPNFFRRVTAEGAFSVSFVPMFSGMEETKGRGAALDFASEARSMMLLILFPFTVCMIVAMPWVISAITPGFIGDAVRFGAAVELSRITFPYILLISLVALYGGVLNSFERFAAFAAAPVFFNLTLIAAIVGLTPYTPTVGHAMAYGVAASGIVQLIWMILNCYRFEIELKLKKPSLTPEIKKLFRLMGPAIIGAGVVQINLFVDMILASFLPHGAISYLYYADRLYQLPLAVIGIAIGTALLPMLSRKIKAGDKKGATVLTRDAVKYGLILSIPAAVALAVLAELIMQVLFERGAFDRAASLASAAALNAYVFGLPAYILVKIFSTGFFAGEDTKTPVKFAIITTICNTLLSIALIKPMGHVGIATATAITAWVNVVLLARAARVNFENLWDGMKPVILYILMVSGVMALSIGWIYALSDNHTLAEKAMDLIMIVIGGATVYFVLLHLTGVMRFSEIRQIFQKPKA